MILPTILLEGVAAAQLVVATAFIRSFSSSYDTGIAVLCYHLMNIIVKNNSRMWEVYTQICQLLVDACLLKSPLLWK